MAKSEYFSDKSEHFAHLQEKYRNDSAHLSESIASIIYDKAYEDAHAHGWQEIEYQYLDLMEFSNRVLKAFTDKVVASYKITPNH